jgi:hypothetical protein
VKDYSRHLTRFTLCNLAVSPRFLQRFHKKIAWPTDTRFSMVAEPFRELVEFMICEFAILDNGVTGLETHFYRNHSWLFFKVFGLGFQVLKPDVFVVNSAFLIESPPRLASFFCRICGSRLRLIGNTWIDLGDGFGIHGTPEPQKIGKTHSHGCVRLTNWDAQALGKMVHKGTKVDFIN